MSERPEITVETPDDEKLDKFKADVARDADIVEDQRDKANEDMRFVNVDGGMWEGFLDDDDLDRVKLELDIASNFVQMFIGEWNQNRVGVEFEPDDSKTSDEDTELVNGIYRADFRQFSGKLSTDNAVDEAATCGYGAFKMATVFEDESDVENDNMRIEWRPIYNAYNTVIWDQSAQRIDKRDARWCTVLKEFTKEGFEEVYPDKSPVSAYTPNNRAFENVTRSTPDIIYIAKRYEVVRKRVPMFVYNNLATGEVEVYSKEDHDLIEDELKADELRKFVRIRKVLKQSIELTVFSGDEILQETRRLPGKWIPIIPMYGYRAYVDGVEWYRGLVRKLKDASRLFNMQVSQLAENAASTGQEVPIFTTDQMENEEVKATWIDRNNKPYMIVDPVKDNDGNIVQTGPIGYLKPPQLDGSTTALLSLVPEYIRGVTGGAPQDTFNPDMSGKAIKAIIKRENMKTQVINDNIALAIEWSGTVYISMAEEIYNTQRIMRTIGRDGTKGKTQLRKTILDEETGRLIEINTLGGKKFHSFSDSGPQYDTLRQETVEDLKGMLEALAAVPGGEKYMDALLAVLIDNISGVGLGPIKDLNRRIMLSQGLVKPANEEEEAMLAQLQAPQEDPNQELLAAAANQQNAEARSLDAGSVQKIADAKKKEAETIEIFADIENEQNKTGLQAQKMANEARQQTLKTLENLPVQ